MADEKKALGLRFSAIRGNEEDWKKSSVILRKGEIAISYNSSNLNSKEKEVPKIKIGNGKDTWENLPFITDMQDDEDNSIKEIISNIRIVQNEGTFYLEVNNVEGEHLTGLLKNVELGFDDESSFNQESGSLIISGKSFGIRDKNQISNMERNILNLDNLNISLNNTAENPRELSILLNGNKLESNEDFGINSSITINGTVSNFSVNTTEETRFDVNSGNIFLNPNSLGIPEIKNSINTINTNISNLDLNINNINTNLNAHINNTSNPHKVTKAQVDLGNVDNTADIDKPISTATQNALNTIEASINSTNANVSSHIDDTSNPHKVTKAQVGLGNVDNTADIDKPISTATQGALNNINLNINTVKNNLSSHTSDTSNPHHVTKAQVNLGNVDNTSDADKPISTATQSALNNINLDINTVKSNLNSHINDTSNPHQVTKAQVGLGNVANVLQYSEENQPPYPVTSVAGKTGAIVLSKNDIGLGNVDNTADLNKPVSIATENLISNTKTEILGNASESFNSLEKIEGILNKNVLSNILLNNSPENVSLQVNITNIATGINDNTSISFPLASNTQTGLMSKEDYEQLRENTERINALENKTTRLLYNEKTNPTSEEINTFVMSQGYSAPFEGIAVVVDGTFHIWHYYENDNIGWKDDGQDTVSNFTNESSGIILGSLSDGKIYAESDGTGSVNGWDTVKTDISNLSNNKLDKSSVLNALGSSASNPISQSAVSTAINNISSNLNSHISASNPHNITADSIGLGNVDNTADIDKPISTATQTALNSIELNVNNIKSNLSLHINDISNPHSVTKAQVGLGNVDNTSDINKPISTATQNALDTLGLNINSVEDNLESHANSISNPHSVTKAQVGLGNVDNTSDADKPISTATQTALDNLGLNINSVKNNLESHANSTSNPHSVTKAQVGLGNVDNTADINKPISTATQNALDNINVNINGLNSQISSHTSNISNPHSVTKAQIGLGNVADILQYSEENQPPYPVKGITGNGVSINAETNIVSINLSTGDLSNGANIVIDGSYVHTDNNYTTEEKEKLALLNNYDDSVVKTQINSIINNETKIHTNDGGFVAGLNSTANVSNTEIAISVNTSNGSITNSKVINSAISIGLNTESNSGISIGENVSGAPGSISIGSNISANPITISENIVPPSVLIGHELLNNQSIISIGANVKPESGGLGIGYMINGGSLSFGLGISGKEKSIIVGSSITGNHSFIFGININAPGSIAIGENIASQDNAIVIGKNASAVSGSIQLGSGNNTTGGLQYISYKVMDDTGALYYKNQIAEEYFATKAELGDISTALNSILGV